MKMNEEKLHSFFGDPQDCESDLIAIGGDMKPETLFYAYTHGIFPWTEDPIRWFCLEPRAIFDLETVRPSRTVQRKMKKGLYRITWNQAFREVMHCCSFRPAELTWITEQFILAYTKFHEEGYAHSVEAWDEAGHLVGGVYGVAIGKFFAGESMFSFQSDAGKVALFHLFDSLKQSNFQLFDTQQLNHVTIDLGAFEIPKAEYLKRLENAVMEPSKWTPICQ